VLGLCAKWFHIHNVYLRLTSLCSTGVLQRGEGALPVLGRALNPAIQIDHPKNNDSSDCLPVPARRARRLSGQSAEKFWSIWNFRQQHNRSRTRTPTWLWADSHKE